MIFTISKIYKNWVKAAEISVGHICENLKTFFKSDLWKSWSSLLYKKRLYIEHSKIYFFIQRAKNKHGSQYIGEKLTYSEMLNKVQS